MTLGAVADWAVIVTAGIAVAALLGGAFWWYWVVHRWSDRVRSDLKTLDTLTASTTRLSLSQLDLQRKYPEGDHTQRQLDAIITNLTCIQILLFFQFEYDHAYKTPHRELQEIRDVIAKLSVQSPITLKRDGQGRNAS